MDGSLFAAIFMALILAMFIFGTPMYIIGVHIYGWSTGNNAGLSLKTIKRSLQDLKDEGWISVWEPGGRWIEGTTYEMAPEWANGKEC